MVDLADDDYFEFFKWMNITKKLENAILIFMGDHGPRYSEIQNTEDKSFIILQQNFKSVNVSKTHRRYFTYWNIMVL
jgi:arylsulfatase A-like enzyme